METTLAFASTSAFTTSTSTSSNFHPTNVHGPLHAGIQISACKNRSGMHFFCENDGRFRTSMFMSENSNIDNDNDGEYEDFELDRRGIIDNSDDQDKDDFFDEDALLELLALDDDLDNHSQEPRFDELKELEQLLEQGMSDSWNDDDDDDEEDDDDDLVLINDTREEKRADKIDAAASNENMNANAATLFKTLSPSALEKALLQGVVPASAGVGSKCLPADYGFDPLGLATKDYFKNIQNFLINLLPDPGATKNAAEESEELKAGAALPLITKPFLADLEERPPALVLRDYRDIEIRHGRLAMLAALLWPLQEIMDRLFIPDSFGSTTMIYGGVTLPFISLFMTLAMLLLGYLDIYAASIKDQDTGEAFLPGECFWDPLSILDGAPDDMKRNMQARELNNGRFAMIAVLSYILQEGITHQPLILLPWNQVLFEPAFEIPAVQAWLDGQFAGTTAVTDTGMIGEILELNDGVSNDSLLL